MKDESLAPSGSQPSHEPRPLGSDEILSPRGPEPAGSNPRGAPTIGVREAAALLLFALAVVFLYLANAAVPPAAPAALDIPAQNLELRFQAQFELGVRRLFPLPVATLDGAEDGNGPGASSHRLQALAETPREEIALVPVRVHLHDRHRAEAREAAMASLSSMQADESLDTEIRAEASLFVDWLDNSDVEFGADERDQLLSTYGYFARLMIEPDAALEEARQTALVFYLLAVAVLLALLVGAVALVFLLRRMSQGKLRSAYGRANTRHEPFDEPIFRPTMHPVFQPAQRLPYLETALLFLVAVTVVGGLVGLAMGDSGSHWLLLLNWAVVAVLFWPMARGRSWSDLRSALGWNRGRGVLREMGCGLLAYLASMPMLAVGLALTLVFTRFAEQPPHHPIVDWLQEAGSGGIAVVVILAVLWAPLVEESLFRGALYHYFRGRLGIFGSVFVVSLAFAAIHPQGLAGIPFLTSLAAALALTREWRDSIVASVTLHMVHNGLATVLLLALLS